MFYYKGIVMENKLKEKFMQEAIKEAKKAYKKLEVFGIIFIKILLIMVNVKLIKRM